jgi:hypothetical protein
MPGEASRDELQRALNVQRMRIDTLQTALKVIQGNAQISAQDPAIPAQYQQLFSDIAWAAKQAIRQSGG